MLRYSALLVLLLSETLSYAAYIDTSKVLSDLDSWGNSLGNDDTFAASDAENIDEHTWSRTYQKLASDLEKIAQEIKLEIAVYQRFINELDNQDEDCNSQYVYVPDDIFNYLVSNLKKVEVCLTNALNTNLTNEFLDNPKVFTTINGTLAIPQSLLYNIFTTLTNIAEQFGCVQDAAVGLQQGFTEIGQAIKVNATKSDYAPQIYQQIADTAKPCAVKLGGIGLHLIDYINTVNNITTLNPNGNFIIVSNSMAKATDNLVDQISADFHELAVYIKLFVKNAANLVKGK